MDAHGAGGDRETARDLSIPKSGRGEPKDLALRGRESEAGAERGERVALNAGSVQLDDHEPLAGCAAGE